MPLACFDTVIFTTKSVQPKKSFFLYLFMLSDRPFKALWTISNHHLQISPTKTFLVYLNPFAFILNQPQEIKVNFFTPRIFIQKLIRVLMPKAVECSTLFMYAVQMQYTLQLIGLGKWKYHREIILVLRIVFVKIG